MNIMNVNDSSILAKHGIFNTEQTSIQEEDQSRKTSFATSANKSKTIMQYKAKGSNPNIHGDLNHLAISN